MTVTLKDKNQLLVPLSVQRRAGLKTGARLEFKVSGSVITIVPKPPPADDEYTPEQRRINNARLAKADEDTKAGRVYGPFNTAEQMAARGEKRSQARPM